MQQLSSMRQFPRNGLWKNDSGVAMRMNEPKSDSHLINLSLVCYRVCTDPLKLQSTKCIFDGTLKSFNIAHVLSKNSLTEYLNLFHTLSYLAIVKNPWLNSWVQIYIILEEHRATSIIRLVFKSSQAEQCLSYTSGQTYRQTQMHYPHTPLQ